MRVRTLKPIEIGTFRLAAGEVVDIADDTAERWIRIGAAEPAAESRLRRPERTLLVTPERNRTSRR